MRQVYIKFTGICLIMLMQLLTGSCTKYVAGPQGDPGEPGKPGNLKQLSTSTIKVPSSSWSIVNFAEWEATLFIPEITRDVIEKGEVKIYMDVNSSWCPMPYGKGFIFTQFRMQTGTITLNCSHAHGGVPDQPLETNFRVVIYTSAK